MALYRNLVERMKRIKSNPESGNPRNEKQVGAMDRRLKAAMHEYQKADSEYRNRLKQQKRRDYLNVHPDAPEAELRAAEEDYSDTNVYQQSVSMVVI